MRFPNTSLAVLLACGLLGGDVLACSLSFSRYVVTSPVRVRVEAGKITKGLRVSVSDPSHDFNQVAEAITDDQGLAFIDLPPGDYFVSAKGAVLGGSGADLTVVSTRVDRVLDEQVSLGWPFWEVHEGRIARGKLGPPELFSYAEMKLYQEPEGALVAETTADGEGNFDFGQVKDGAYAIEIFVPPQVPSGQRRIPESLQSGQVALRIYRESQREDLRMDLTLTSCGLRSREGDDTERKEPVAWKSSCGLEANFYSTNSLRVVSDDGMNWVEVTKDTDTSSHQHSARAWTLDSGAALVVLEEGEQSTQGRLWTEVTQYCFYADGTTRISSNLRDYRGSQVLEAQVVERTWRFSGSSADVYEERTYDDKSREIVSPGPDLRALLNRLPVYRRVSELPFYPLMQAHAASH